MILMAAHCFREVRSLTCSMKKPSLCLYALLARHILAQDWICKERGREGGKEEREEGEGRGEERRKRMRGRLRKFNGTIPTSRSWF